jgi:hypothetical protein
MARTIQGVILVTLHTAISAGRDDRASVLSLAAGKQGVSSVGPVGNQLVKFQVVGQCRRWPNVLALARREVYVQGPSIGIYTQMDFRREAASAVPGQACYRSSSSAHRDHRQNAPACASTLLCRTTAQSVYRGCSISRIPSAPSAIETHSAGPTPRLP